MKITKQFSSYAVTLGETCLFLAVVATILLILVIAAVVSEDEYVFKGGRW